MTREVAGGGRRLAIPFPGGLISGALVVLALEPEGRHWLAWLALVPLFLSFERHQGRTSMRVIHALLFGAVIASYVLWSGIDAPGLLNRVPELITFQAFLRSFLTGVMTVIVAGACGPILRSGKWLFVLVAIPSLWSGLDYLRHDLAGFTANRLSLSLSLAHAIPPSTPSAQAAATVGIHGLAFLVVLVNTLVFLALRERGLTRRIAAAAAAFAVPAGLHFAGAAVLPAKPAPGTLAVATAAGTARSLDEVVRLVEPMEVHGGLLLLPPVVEELAISEARPLLAGLAARKRAHVLAAGAQSDGAVAVWLIDRAGGLVERPRSGLLPLEAGTVGVGTGGDFHRPAHARRLSRDGATLLALIDDRAGGGTRGEALRSTVQAYRAVENRRWLVKAGPGGAFIADPYGRVVARVAPGIAGAVLDAVDFLEGQSVYTRAGAWIEGLLAAGAAAILLASWIASLIARNRAGPRGGSPAGPSP